MSQLTNFIPKTAKECQALLKDLNENRDGIAIADRYGRIDALNAEEVKALIELIRNQIGETAQAPAADQIQKTVKKAVDKTLETTVKKTPKKPTKK